MEIKNLLIIVFLLSMISLNAQFVDDMESYTEGQPIFEGHWTDWNCGGGPGCAMMSSSANARSGFLSGLIPDDGTTDGILDLDNKIIGLWGLEFYMYLDSGKEGYWALQGRVPLQSGEWIVGNIFFNRNNETPGEGYIDYGPNITDDETFFNFPHDEWFRIVMNFDISAGISLATWQFNVDGVDVIPAGTLVTNEDGDIPTGLGGVLFFSHYDVQDSGPSEFYIDDFLYTNALIDILAIDDHNLNSKGFSATPNPVGDFLQLKANEKISEVIVYNTLGQEVNSYYLNSVDDSIDMSSYDKGVYILKVKINGIQGSVKIIK